MEIVGRRSRDLATAIEMQKRGYAEDTFWIGVCPRMGGHGDWLIACTIGRAAKEYWRGMLGDTRPVAVLVIGNETELPEDLDIALGQPDVDQAVRLPVTHWLPRAQVAADHFDVFYDGQYAWRTRCRQLHQSFAHYQAEANARLADWRRYYDGFPEACHHLGKTGVSQWQVMTQTLGFDVRPDDLVIPTTAPAVKGWDRESVVTLKAFDGCVTIHNGQGETRGTKVLPQPVLDEISLALNRAGHQVVQLGLLDNKAEPPVKGAVDLRGLRINETAFVIEHAKLHVDGEGGLVVVARAVDTRSVVFFASTPRSLFGFDGNANYSRAICPEPTGPHCFWCCPTWSAKCPLGFEYCVNLPQPETAARVVLDALDATTETPILVR